MLEEGHNYDSHVKKFIEVGFGKQCFGLSELKLRGQTARNMAI